MVRNPKADTLKQPTTSDRGSAVRTSMLLVGVLVAGVSLLHLPTSLQLTERSSLLVTVGGSAKSIMERRKLRPQGISR